jgi:hypothetical protein
MRCSCATQEDPSPVPSALRGRWGPVAAEALDSFRDVFEVGLFPPDPAVMLKCVVDASQGFQCAREQVSHLDGVDGSASLRLQGFSKCGGGVLGLAEGFQANADLRHGPECKSRILGGEGKLLQRIFMHDPAFLSARPRS